nr:MAG TPA: hypothetical protein [Caudoviricetes sp.]
MLLSSIAYAALHSIALNYLIKSSRQILTSRKKPLAAFLYRVCRVTQHCTELSY